eukprot:4953165-Pleurochrysis_carterae.AAC.1
MQAFSMHFCRFAENVHLAYAADLDGLLALLGLASFKRDNHARHACRLGAGIRHGLRTQAL